MQPRVKLHTTNFGELEQTQGNTSTLTKDDGKKIALEERKWYAEGDDANPQTYYVDEENKEWIIKEGPVAGLLLNAVALRALGVLIPDFYPALQYDNDGKSKTVYVQRKFFNSKTINFHKITPTDIQKLAHMLAAVALLGNANGISPQNVHHKRDRLYYEVENPLAPLEKCNESILLSKLFYLDTRKNTQVFDTAKKLMSINFPLYKTSINEFFTHFNNLSKKLYQKVMEEYFHKFLQNVDKGFTADQLHKFCQNIINSAEKFRSIIHTIREPTTLPRQLTVTSPIGPAQLHQGVRQYQNPHFNLPLQSAPVVPQLLKPWITVEYQHPQPPQFYPTAQHGYQTEHKTPDIELAVNQQPQSKELQELLKTQQKILAAMHQTIKDQEKRHKTAEEQHKTALEQTQTDAKWTQEQLLGALKQAREDAQWTREQLLQTLKQKQTDTQRTQQQFLQALENAQKPPLEAQAHVPKPVKQISTSEIRQRRNDRQQQPKKPIILTKSGEPPSKEVLQKILESEHKVSEAHAGMFYHAPNQPAPNDIVTTSGRHVQKRSTSTVSTSTTQNPGSQAAKNQPRANRRR